MVEIVDILMKFMSERTLFEASNDSLGNPVQRSRSIISISLETIAILFKVSYFFVIYGHVSTFNMNYGILFHSKYWVIQVLQANVGQLASRDLAEEMKRLHFATVHVNPRLLSVGASEQS